MKYVSIDIETTGLDPRKCQILEFAAVAEDTRVNTPVNELPHFRRLIRPGRIKGEPYALALNARLIKELANNLPNSSIAPGQLGSEFAYWLRAQGFGAREKIVVAGKNFASFDLQFLKRLPHFSNYVTFHHRFLDPAMYFIDWLEDETPPSSKEVMERAGMAGDVSHEALDDARQVISMLRAGPYYTHRIFTVVKAYNDAARSS